GLKALRGRAGLVVGPRGRGGVLVLVVVHARRQLVPSFRADERAQVHQARQHALELRRGRRQGGGHQPRQIVPVGRVVGVGGRGKRAGLGVARLSRSGSHRLPSAPAGAVVVRGILALARTPTLSGLIFTTSGDL